MFKNSQNIVILPGKNGLKLFAQFFCILAKYYHKPIFYAVVGGWLPETLDNNSRLIKCLNNFKGIFLETNSMAASLNAKGLKRVYFMPNFKTLNIFGQQELVYSIEEPHRLCTFSRIFKEKGIEDAINAVKNINDKLGRIAYTLDLYGMVESWYEQKFTEIVETLPAYIKYKGIVSSDSCTNILKNYYSLLFPTYYDGEGFAGTILDAYAAGIPVICTDWKYNSEIVHNNFTGLVYSVKEKNGLEDILTSILDNPNKINAYKVNCLDEAYKYDPQEAVKILTHHFAIDNNQYNQIEKSEKDDDIRK
ncbi:Glycosyltransferase Gtf1 [bioreactor metagenome]|uniref:Glycosyltransferase Gtf1 n=1 Tax=bioreactor metagenome TaxID=1076179 RepID=A0A644ZS07_9ZZZZ